MPVLLSAALLGGCELAATSADEPTSMMLSLGSSAFDGTSVAVSGQRSSPADPLYRCLSTLPTTCLNLDAGATVTVSGLCPSLDVDAGTWNFSYQLFSQPGCAGTLLTPDSGIPYRCFDSRDVFSQRNPNQTRGDVLLPGTNRDEILCIDAPYQLVFVQQPTTTTAGTAISPSVTVQVQDFFGNNLASSGITVTISVASGPGGFSGSSTTTATTDSTGLATFSNLVLNTVGTYTLLASASGLVSATSHSFNVVSTTPTFLVYTATGPFTTRTSSGSATVLYPSGTSPNDLLFLVEINSANQNITTPTGWALLADQATGTPAQFRFTVWWRLAGTETSVVLSINTNSSGASACVIRYRRPSGYPPNPALATATVRQGIAGATATLTPSPNVTTNQSNATVISVVSIRAANPLSLSSAQGFTLQNATTSTPPSGNGVGLGVADLLVASASTPPSPTWAQTGTPAQWAWMTVAFH